MLNRAARYGILGAAALLALSAPAFAQSARDNTDGVELPRSTAGSSTPSCGEGCFAVIRTNGTLARGQGVSRTARLGEGVYEVIFQHNVSRCAFVAPIGRPGFIGVEPPGFITVAGRVGTRNGVFIATWNPAVSFEDRAFHLVVQCPESGD